MAENLPQPDAPKKKKEKKLHEPPPGVEFEDIPRTKAASWIWANDRCRKVTEITRQHIPNKDKDKYVFCRRCGLWLSGKHGTSSAASHLETEHHLYKVEKRKAPGGEQTSGGETTPGGDT
jgi:hypothetical protein